MVVETDASDYALSAILSLFDDEGVLIWSLSTLGHLPVPNSITMSTIKNYWQFSKLFSIGDII
jgi:hypothetical protein